MKLANQNDMTACLIDQTYAIYSTKIDQEKPNALKTLNNLLCLFGERPKECSDMIIEDLIMLMNGSDLQVASHETNWHVKRWLVSSHSFLIHFCFGCDVNILSLKF